MAILGTMKKEPHNLPYIIIEVDSYYYIFFFDFENRNTYGIFKIRNTILHTYIHKILYKQQYIYIFYIEKN